VSSVVWDEPVDDPVQVGAAAQRLREVGVRLEDPLLVLHAPHETERPVADRRDGAERVVRQLSGRLDKTFDADAYHQAEGLVVKVEAGRGVVHNQFLKDLFQACMMHEVRYLAIAVRNTYRRLPDFERVLRFFDTLYASNRLRLPLDGVLIIGY
jgi:hypothetical protein